MPHLRFVNRADPNDVIEKPNATLPFTLTVGEGGTEGATYDVYLVSAPAAEGLSVPVTTPPPIPVADWTVQASSAALSITVHRATHAQFAPEAMFFEATPTGFSGLSTPGVDSIYIPEMHEIQYEWDFGDAGAVYTAPQNVPTAWTNANKAYSQVASHVFEAPGTYTVTCTARKVVSLDPITIEEATATAEVTVVSADGFFDPVPAGGSTINRTICVALDGDFTGADPTWTQVSSEADGDPNSYQEVAKTLLQDLENNADDPADAGYVRILFKRGEVYANNSNLHHVTERYTTGVMRALLVGAWGDAADPAPDIARFRMEGNVNVHGNKPWDVVYDGIHFNGDYDNYVQSPGTRTHEAFVFPNEGNSWVLIANCHIENHATGVSHNTLHSDARYTERQYLTVFNTSMSGLRTYGLYQADRATPNPEVTWWAMLGCRDVDIGDAPVGNSGNLGVGNAQGPIRAEAKGVGILDGCDFFGRYGWSGGGAWPDGKDRGAPQVLRLLTASGPDYPSAGGRMFVNRCSMEGDGFLSIGGTTGQVAPKGNVVVDGFIHVVAPGGGSTIASQTGNLTVRNGLVIKPEATAEIFAYNDFMNFSGIGIKTQGAQDATPAWHLDEPIRAYNNTVVVRHGHPSQTIEWVDNNDGYTDIVEENNVLYAPAYPSETGDIDIAPYDYTALFATRWLGRREVTADALEVDYAYTPGQISLYQPQAGSAVIGALSAGNLALFDLLGQPRPASTPSIGALEPAS